MNEMEKRILRLEDIYEDNLFKSEAPFLYQLDMLEEEIEDITKASLNAVQDQNDYFTDLQERIADF